MQSKKLIFTTQDMCDTVYIVKSPVLFLVFNRPEATKRVFQTIRSVKPSRLYIGADGPRLGNIKDAQLCKEVRDIIALVDWPCAVYYLYSEENRGCKLAVSAAIDWFFKHEEEGIILEDDCLPVISFFYFCDKMLEKYRSEKRIFCITGCNAQKGIQRGPASYYFSELSNIWGWASWRRTWNLYEPDLDSYSDSEAFILLQKKFKDPLLTDIWMEFFVKLKKGMTDTWDQQFQFITFFNDGLCITPNVNLINNIGFGPDATHTFDQTHYQAEVGELTHIYDPIYIIPDTEADYFLYSHEFKLDEKRIARKKDKLLRRRFKKWIREIFKSPQ